MNFQDFKSKFKNIIDTSVDFVIRHKRWFLALVIFTALSVVLVMGTDPNGPSGKSSSGVYKSYKLNKRGELKELVDKYYDSYTKGDSETLMKIATPMCDKEASYIQMYSQYIEKISDVKVYSKPGLTKGSYLVTTEYNLKYVDIDTLAPGLDFFYVETNKKGDMYINNTYGSFNQKNNIYEMDPEISELYLTFTYQQDLLEKRKDVQTKYDEALKKDAALKAFMDETLKSAINKWSDDYDAQAAAAAEAQAQAEAQAAEEQAAAEAAAAEEQAAAEAAAAEEQAAAEAAAQEAQQPTTYTGKINSRANVREQANTDSNKLGSMDMGTEITIYGEEGDFYKFDYNGTQAYVTKQVVDVANQEAAGDTNAEATQETAEEAPAAQPLEEGKKINLKATVNLRKSMDANSEKVAVAYEHENVTVVQSYAEGWTKVKYGKKEGYVRTDLLQK